MLSPGNYADGLWRQKEHYAPLSPNMFSNGARAAYRLHESPGAWCKKQNIVLIADVAHVCRIVFQMLNIAVGAWYVAKQGVKSRDVKGMAAGDNSNGCVGGFG